MLQLVGYTLESFTLHRPLNVKFCDTFLSNVLVFFGEASRSHG